MMEFSVPTGDELFKFIKKARKEGKKVRLFVPQDGVSVYFGSDAVEKLEADKRKTRQKRIK